MCFSRRSYSPQGLWRFNQRGASSEISTTIPPRISAVLEPEKMPLPK